MTKKLSLFFKVFCIVFNYRLQVCKWLWVSNMFSLTCSISTLMLDFFCNVPNQVMAFWTTYFKNILIYFKFSIKWPETGTSWNLKNYGFFIWTNSTIGWIGCDDFVAKITCCVGFVMGITSSTNSTCSKGSTWMLSIFWSKLGSGFSSMLPCVFVA